MGPFDLYKMHQMEQLMEKQRQMQAQQHMGAQEAVMGIPSGRFGPGMPTQAPQPSMADQIPGAIPQPAPQEDTMMDMLRRKMMSGGAMDLRNLGMALGPAGQAAGGMGQMAQMANRAGMPGKAMDPAEQMFNMARRAPSMGQGGSIDPRLALGAGMVGAPAALLGPDIYELIQKLKARGQ